MASADFYPATAPPNLGNAGHQTTPLADTGRRDTGVRAAPPLRPSLPARGEGSPGPAPPSHVAASIHEGRMLRNHSRGPGN